MSAPEAFFSTILTGLKLSRRKEAEHSNLRMAKLTFFGSFPNRSATAVDLIQTLSPDFRGSQNANATSLVEIIFAPFFYFCG